MLRAFLRIENIFYKCMRHANLKIYIDRIFNYSELPAGPPKSNYRNARLSSNK